jgi:hypothetical protein
MSGAIATLGDAASVASALETLAFGAAGPVVLGSFAFQDFEVPESITLPVRQAVAVHRLIGGERVLDAMGADYGDVAWAGVMLGGGAQARAQSLKALADAGQAVALTWGTWNFTVLPHWISLREGYQRIVYAIRCTVIRDDSAAPDQLALDLGASLAGDIGAAIAGGGGSVAGALANVQATLQLIGPILPGSAAVRAAWNAVSGAQGVVASAQAAAAAQVAGVGGRAAGLSTPVSTMTDLASAATQTGQLAQAATAGAYLGRMAANLSANN